MPYEIAPLETATPEPVPPPEQLLKTGACDEALEGIEKTRLEPAEPPRESPAGLTNCVTGAASHFGSWLATMR